MSYVVTWPKFIEDLNQLADRIAAAHQPGELRYVLGIPRGGLIPAVVLSHRLGLGWLDFGLPIDRSLGRQVLCVDDIVHNGATMAPFVRRFTTATVYLRRNPNRPFNPDYYVEQVDGWVQFPYEPTAVEQWDGTAVLSHYDETEN